MTTLASITRLQGGLLVLPLFLLYLEQSQFRFRLPFQAKSRWPKIDWAGLALLLSPASLVLFLAYVYFGAGDHNFRQQLERVWGVQLVTPWQALVGGIFKLGEPAQADSFLYNLFNLSLILAFGGLSWLWLRYRLPPVYAIYGFCTLLILLTRQKEGDLWMSMSRYVLALFPVFMLVAWRIRKPGYRTALFALGAVFQVLFVILFLMWKWVA